MEELIACRFRISRDFQNFQDFSNESDDLPFTIKDQEIFFFEILCFRKGLWLRKKKEGYWKIGDEAHIGPRCFDEGHYRNGKKEGLWTVWRCGIKLSESCYHKGKIRGLWTNFYPNGAKRSQVIYRKSVPIGLSIEWNPDGTKFREGNFEKGKMTGSWKYYLPDGNFKLINF